MSSMEPTTVQYDCRPSRYFGNVPGGASVAIAVKKSFIDSENDGGLTASSRMAYPSPPLLSSSTRRT